MEMKQYHFNSRAEMHEAMKWFRESGISDWYYVPRFLPGPKHPSGLRHYIVAKFKEHEADKMLLAEFKYG